MTDTGHDHDHDSARARAPTDDASTLAATLHDGPPPDRRDAALGLRALAAEEPLSDDARAALATATDPDAEPDPDVRQFAVEALGAAGADATARDAVAAALSDPDEWVRAEAVVALSRTAGEDAADRLRSVATDDDAGPVRRNALVALAKAGTAEGTTVVDRLKHDPDAGVREYAARFLPTVLDDDERTVRLLAALLARDPEAFVRAKAATALGEVGSDRAVEVLETHGVDDRSDDVQRAARRALAVARGEPPSSVDAAPSAPGGGPGSRGPGDGSAPGRGRGPRPNATVPSPDAGRRPPGGDGP